MTDAPEQVEHRRLDQLETHPDNPKAHDIATLQVSLSRFGLAEPLVIDARTGRILAGHGRAEALAVMRDSGQPVPGGVSTDEDGGWLVPCYTGWASADDDEAAAALVALNRTTETGGWHEAPLADLLETLRDVDDGLAGVGYGDDDIAALRERLGEHVADADRAMESEPVRPYSATYFLVSAPLDRHGDVWAQLAPLEDMEGVHVADSQR